MRLACAALYCLFSWGFGWMLGCADEVCYAHRCISFRSSTAITAFWVCVWVVAGSVYLDWERGGEWDGDGWVVVKGSH